MGLFPEQKIHSVVYEKVDCVSQQGRDCRQYFRTILCLKEGTCTLDGTYSLNFDVNCGENEIANNNCSLSLPSDYLASVTYKLKSENFCAAITVDVGIIGKISSHENQTFTGSKQTFIIGRRVYYLVKVNSDLNEPKSPDSYDPSNPKTIILFTKTDLVTVSLKFDNATILRIWKRGALDALGANCESHTSTSTSVNLLKNSIGFSFIMTKNIANPPKNGKVQITVLAEVQVSYPQNKKRADPTDSSTYSTSTEITDDGTGTGATETTGTTTGNTATTGTATTSGQTTGSTTGSATTEKSNSVALIASLIMLIVALI
jgi:hypothetical protein